MHRQLTSMNISSTKYVRSLRKLLNYEVFEDLDFLNAFAFYRDVGLAKIIETDAQEIGVYKFKMISF